MRPDSRRNLHIPVDDISEEDLAKDFNYVRSDNDGLSRDNGRTRDWGPPPGLGKHGSITARDDDEMDVDVDDNYDESSDYRQKEPVKNEKTFFKDSAKDIFYKDSDKEKTKDPKEDDGEGDGANKNTDDDFEQLKSLSSKLQKNAESGDTRTVPLNGTDNEKFKKLLSEYKLAKRKKGETSLPPSDEDNTEPDSTKPADEEVEEQKDIPAKVAHRNDSGRRKLKKQKNSTSKTKWRLNSEFPLSTKSTIVKKLHGRKPPNTATNKTNASENGFDDDAISSMIGQSAPKSANETSFTIEDHGVDKVDIPITGSSNWNTIVHGRREVIIAGCVIAGVGILVLVYAIVHILILRNKRKNSNVNNNKGYRRLGSKDETIALKTSHDPAVFDMSTDDETDDDDMDEEDTLYIRGRRKT